MPPELFRTLFVTLSSVFFCFLVGMGLWSMCASPIQQGGVLFAWIMTNSLILCPTLRARNMSHFRQAMRKNSSRVAESEEGKRL